MDTELQKNLIQRVAVGDIFRRKARELGDKEAVIERRGKTEFRITFGQLNDRINQFARALRARGFKQGDRIGFLCLNSHEFLTAIYGCAKGGFVGVPVNPALNPRDVAYVINHAECVALVVDDQLYPLSQGLAEHLGGIRLFVGINATGQALPEGYENFTAMLDGESAEEVEDVVIDDRDMFEILYTSGTTSAPKGVMVPHVAAFIMSLTNALEFKVDRDAVGTTLLPLFHCAQQTFTNTFLHVGGKTVIYRGFDPAYMLESIEKDRVTLSFLLPAMYRALLDLNKQRPTDFSSLRGCLYAMAPMDGRTLKEGIETFDAEFFLGTGQTECFPSTNTFRGEWQLKKLGNYWGESAITLDTGVMDDNGNLLPPGQVGEIVWRGPGTMLGYYKNEEATAESRAFGWHHSGDLGFYDEDGLLVFVDRKKDMIKTGGENVPSVKVERVILGDPRVASAAVVGLPHERWTEAVTAVVVPAEGQELTEQDVIELCKKELGGFEVPKKVIIAEELPMTSTGKIKKNVVRDQFKDSYSGS
ncbi:MAG: AMP-binding protein [Desulfatibacillaceae bacterium]